VMLFLDTHVVLWLYAEPFRIPESLRPIIDDSELYISPMVRVEMSLLAEIGRLREDPESVVGALSRDIHLSIETAGWSRAAEVANHLSWTRDPFDRLITAHALAYGANLCTRDGTIRDNYAHALWA